jgi:KAP family P-loop domain
MNESDKIRNKLPDINLTDHQRIWIKKIFDIEVKNLPFSKREAKHQLNSQGKLPLEFDPESIPTQIINGNAITVLGVLLFIKDYDIVDKAIELILKIKQEIANNPKQNNFDLVQIPTKPTNIIPIRENTFLLKCFGKIFSLYSKITKDNNISTAFEIDNSIAEEYLKLDKETIIRKIESTVTGQAKYLQHDLLQQQKKNSKTDTNNNKIDEYFNVYIKYEQEDYSGVPQPDEEITIPVITLEEINSYTIAIGMSAKDRIPIDGTSYPVVLPTKIEIYNLEKIEKEGKLKSRGQFKEYVEGILSKEEDKRTALKLTGFDVTSEIIKDFSFMESHSSQGQLSQQPNVENNIKTPSQSITNNETDAPGNKKTIQLRHCDIKIKDRQVKPSFNVSEIAVIFSELITGFKNESGQMVGILGPWGRGKTFFFEEICKKFNLPFNKKNQVKNSEKSSDFILIKFHAWKYQKTPAVWAHLYDVILKEYLDVDFIEKIRRIFLFNINSKGHWKSWGKSVTLISLGTIIVQIALVLKISVQQPSPLLDEFLMYLGSGIITISVFGFVINTNKLIRAMSSPINSLIFNFKSHPKFTEHLGLQAKIQCELKNLLCAWLKRDTKKRILLFVDDIDRCSYENMIDLVDSIRVMLDEPEIISRMVVVVAADEEKLKLAIRKKYTMTSNSDLLDLKKLDSEYLDKLFILSIKLPPLNFEHKKEYFLNLLKTEKGIEDQSSSKTNQKTEKTDLPDPESRSDSNEPPTIETDFGTNFNPNPAIENDHTKANAENSNEGKNKTTKAIRMEYHKDLSPDEIDHFNECIKNEEISPRGIRIQYYRYLLARNLWNQLYGEGFPYNEFLTKLLCKGSKNKKEQELIPEELEYILNMVKAY